MSCVFATAPGCIPNAQAQLSNSSACLLSLYLLLLCLANTAACPPSCNPADVTVCSCWAGFVVNTSFIGTNANQIGMNLSNWQKCYQCGTALGTCTAVQGGSPYDQFSTFRSSSLAAVLASGSSNCSWIANSAMLFGTSQYPVQLLACDYAAGLLSVSLQLNATAYGIIPTAPTLSLVNSGQYAWPSGSLTGGHQAFRSYGVQALQNLPCSCYQAISAGQAHCDLAFCAFAIMHHASISTAGIRSGCSCCPARLVCQIYWLTCYSTAADTDAQSHFQAKSAFCLCWVVWQATQQRFAGRADAQVACTSQ